MVKDTGLEEAGFTWTKARTSATHERIPIRKEIKKRIDGNDTGDPKETSINRLERNDTDGPTDEWDRKDTGLVWSERSEIDPIEDGGNKKEIWNDNQPMI